MDAGATGGGPMGGGGPVGGFRSDTAAATSGGLAVPHPPQNRLPGTCAAPQVVQPPGATTGGGSVAGRVAARALPHVVQNRLSAGPGTPQVGHGTRSVMVSPSPQSQ